MVAVRLRLFISSDSALVDSPQSHRSSWSQSSCGSNQQSATEKHMRGASATRYDQTTKQHLGVLKETGKPESVTPQN